VWFDGFGDSSIDFTLVVWVRMHGVKSKTGLKSDYYYALYCRLSDAGIEIPFPQQDMHIRSIAPKAAEEMSKLKRSSSPAGSNNGSSSI
jgi:small-conductance mechanosensitive channel